MLTSASCLSHCVREKAEIMPCMEGSMTYTVSRWLFLSIYDCDITPDELGKYMRQKYSNVDYMRICRENDDILTLIHSGTMIRYTSFIKGIRNKFDNQISTENSITVKDPPCPWCVWSNLSDFDCQHEYGEMPVKYGKEKSLDIFMKWLGENNISNILKYDNMSTDVKNEASKRFVKFSTSKVRKAFNIIEETKPPITVDKIIAFQLGDDNCSCGWFDKVIEICYNNRKYWWRIGDSFWRCLNNGRKEHNVALIGDDVVGRRNLIRPLYDLYQVSLIDPNSACPFKKIVGNNKVLVLTDLNIKRKYLSNFIDIIGGKMDVDISANDLRMTKGKIILASDHVSIFLNTDENIANISDLFTIHNMDVMHDEEILPCVKCFRLWVNMAHAIIDDTDMPMLGKMKDDLKIFKEIARYYKGILGQDG